MSWQLGSLAVLVLGLAGGFLWYERSAPDSRTVALVGVLAALGALGRVAFAPLPNVKPTTDIVLIAGFALGGAPGYVVGALAALTSNFFFGQGPWTPWQMAGWGGVGLLGALLARLTRGRIGRLRLAALCFPVGFAFTALQDAGSWVTYSDHSVAQLGVYVGKGAAFDLIHAGGCVVFALAFGPDLIGALRRFQVRLRFSWPAPSSAGGPLAAGVIAAVLGLALLAGPGVRGAQAAAQGSRTPLAYLLRAERPDGGFPMAPREPPSEIASAWAAIALASAESRPGGPRLGASGLAGLRRARVRALRYLLATLGPRPDPGALERTLLALDTAAAPDRRFAGASAALAARLGHALAPDGSVSHQTNLTAFAILALRAARARVPRRTLRWLARQADRDGGFNYATTGAVSDVDDTAAAVQALAPVDGYAPVVARALRFIRAEQNPDGGFPDAVGAPSNAQSTAFALQALLAARIRPVTVRRRGSRTPLQYLRALTAPDGAVAYARGNRQTPVWVTAQAELAFLAAPL